MSFKYFFKKVIHSKTGRHIFVSLMVFYIGLVHKTTKWQVVHSDIPKSFVDKNQPFIVAFWHGRLSMLAFAWQWSDKQKFAMLLSGHRDGQIIARIVERFGILTLAGSSTRQGKEAVLKIIRLLKSNNTVGITPDGPQGPNQQASDGVIHIARLAKVPIIPVTFSKTHRKHLKTWDQFLFPLPFGKGVFLWGDPIFIPQDISDDEVKVFQEKVQNTMNELQTQADCLCKS